MTSKATELDKAVAESGADELLGLTPGKLLKDERERIGLSVEDIAMRLRLRVCVIESIERDDYRDMVADVFLKGYLRSYAKVLSLVPEDVIAQFEALGVELIPKPAAPQLWQNFKPQEKKEKPFKSMLLISGVFTFLLLLVWLANVVFFHHKGGALEQDNMTMNVLGTKNLAQTDLSKLQAEKQVNVVKSVKPPAAKKRNKT